MAVKLRLLSGNFGNGALFSPSCFPLFTTLPVSPTASWWVSAESSLMRWLFCYSALHFAFPRALTLVLPQHSLRVANMRFRVCSAIANPVRPPSFLVRSHMYLLVRFPVRQFFFLSDLCVFEDLLYTKPVPQWVPVSFLPVFRVLSL